MAPSQEAAIIVPQWGWKQEEDADVGTSLMPRLWELGGDAGRHRDEDGGDSLRVIKRQENKNSRI